MGDDQSQWTVLQDYQEKMIAIVAALDEELNELCKSINIRFKRDSPLVLTYIDEKELLLIKSGMGRERVEQSLRSALREYSPTAVISTGFAGALLEEMEPGEIVLAEQILSINHNPFRSGERLCSDRALLEGATELSEELDFKYRLGPILTAPRIMKAEEKRELGHHCLGIAVDMESYWAAEVAQACGIPFLGVRLILDTVDNSLPPIDTFVSKESRSLAFSTLAWLGAHPGQLGRLLKLARAMKRAQNTLAQFVIPLVKIFEVYHSGN